MARVNPIAYVVVAAAAVGLIVFYIGFTDPYKCHKQPGSSTNVESYLAQKFPTDDKRYTSFHHSLRLIRERGLKTIIETGTSRDGCKNCRGDGCSTVIFSEWVKDNGGTFSSVDIDGDCIAGAARGLGSDLQNSATLIVSDSLRFLRDYQGTIDFLYLDSYDFDEDDPKPSQEHHLKEIEIALPKLTKNSVVLIDDTGLKFGGKGTLAIEYLKKNGWKVIYDGYQTLLIHGSTSDKGTASKDGKENRKSDEKIDL